MVSKKAKTLVTLTVVSVVVFFASVSIPQGEQHSKMRYLDRCFFLSLMLVLNVHRFITGSISPIS